MYIWYIVRTLLTVVRKTLDNGETTTARGPHCVFRTAEHEEWAEEDLLRWQRGAPEQTHIPHDRWIFSIVESMRIMRERHEETSKAYGPYTCSSCFFSSRVYVCGEFLCSP